MHPQWKPLQPTVFAIWLLACSRVTAIIQIKPLAMAAVRVSSCTSLVMWCNCLSHLNACVWSKPNGRVHDTSRKRLASTACSSGVYVGVNSAVPSIALACTYTKHVTYRNLHHNESSSGNSALTFTTRYWSNVPSSAVRNPSITRWSAGLELNFVFVRLSGAILFNFC
jgi:hypothetical protein